MRPSPSRRSLTWESLSPADRDAVSAAATDAAGRAAVAIGAVATAGAAIAAARRSSPPLPRGLRVGGGLFAGLVAAYAGAASAVRPHAEALMATPGSPLGEELRTAVGDWGGRVKVKDVADVEPDAAPAKRGG